MNKVTTADRRQLGDKSKHSGDDNNDSGQLQPAKKPSTSSGAATHSLRRIVTKACCDCGVDDKVNRYLALFQNELVTTPEQLRYYLHECSSKVYNGTPDMLRRRLLQCIVADRIGLEGHQADHKITLVNEPVDLILRTFRR
jgi:hypothetical protein